MTVKADVTERRTDQQTERVIESRAATTNKPDRAINGWAEMKRHTGSIKRCS